MKKPAQPPQLPQGDDQRAKDGFERWLYLFWEYTVGIGASGTATATDTILPGRVFDRGVTLPIIGMDAQRILEGQIFGG